MGLFDNFAKLFAKETAKEVLKSPKQRESEKGQKEADEIGKEMGVDLEFVEHMTEEEYEESIRKENEDYENILNRVDDECRLICDRVYDLYLDFQNGHIPRLEMYETIDKARAEVKKCTHLAVNKNGHNTSAIGATIAPAVKWLDEMEVKISRI